MFMEISWQAICFGLATVVVAPLPHRLFLYNMVDMNITNRPQPILIIRELFFLGITCFALFP